MVEWPCCHDPLRLRLGFDDLLPQRNNPPTSSSDRQRLWSLSLATTRCVASSRLVAHSLPTHTHPIHTSPAPSFCRLAARVTARPADATERLLRLLPIPHTVAVVLSSLLRLPLCLWVHALLVRGRHLILSSEAPDPLEACLQGRVYRARSDSFLQGRERRWSPGLRETVPGDSHAQGLQSHGPFAPLLSLTLTMHLSHLCSPSLPPMTMELLLVQLPRRISSHSSMLNLVRASCGGNSSSHLLESENRRPLPSWHSLSEQQVQSSAIVDSSHLTHQGTHEAGRSRDGRGAGLQD